MKRRAFLSIALATSSVGLLRSTAYARPRYGGTLRVYPNLPAVDREPLSRIAASIVPDADRRTWRIALRPYILQHDNTPLNATVAADAIKALQPTWTVTQHNSWSLSVTTPGSVDFLELADAKFPCGPFERVEGPKPYLRAFDLYWDRRPFIDAIELAATAQDADVAELPLVGARRPRSDTHRLWTTSAMETVSVHIGSHMATSGLSGILSLSIDRQSIGKVLLGGRGEPAGSLVPQAESGYAFVFPVVRDVVKARSMLVAHTQPQITLGYPPTDALLRQLADRIAVNARDAGLVLQVKPGQGTWNMRRDLWPPFESYRVESAKMDDWRMVPIVHVPRLFAIHSRVQGWEQAHDGRSLDFHPESIWLES